MGELHLPVLRATVQDISRNGIALQVETECKKGAIISIQIENETGPIVLTRPAQVVNIRQVAPGVSVLGCAFCRELTENELQTILRSRGLLSRMNAARLPATPPPTVAKPAVASTSQPERRRSPRRDGKRTAVIVALLNGKRYFGKILNASATGLAIEVPRSITVGSVLRVRAVNAGISVPWATLEVRHCQRTSPRVVGCQFADSRSASLLDSICPNSA
jgi:hypothetical protein